MFLYLECHSALLQFHAERHVEGFVLVGLLRVVGIFHELAFPLPVFVHTDTTLHEVLVQLVQQIKLTGQIHHRTELALAVDQLHGRNAGRLGHLARRPHRKSERYARYPYRLPSSRNLRG